MNGSNKDGTVGITLYLLSQLRDAVVHGSITGALAFGPRGTYEPLARDDNLWPGNEKLQHFELPESDLNRAARTTELHFPEVQGNLPELRHLTDASDLKI